MATFHLKFQDTLPVLIATLQKPDGSVVDLTGTATKLHVRLSGSTTTVTRAMTIEGLPTAGQVKYAWVAADWTGFPALIQGEHRMEYEVLGASSRQTFPNAGYDVLSVLTDLGQG